MKIGLIGYGNMASAIIKGIVFLTEFKKFEYFFYDVDKSKTKTISSEYPDIFVKICDSETEVIEKSEYIILAVKPQSFKSLLNNIKHSVTDEKVIISIAAGITIDYIFNILCNGDNQSKIKIARIMPNTPALVQQGMSGIAFNSFINEFNRSFVVRIFSSLGKTLVVDEEKINSVTSISGSGPAYFFYFAECFFNAALKSGFSPEAAETLVYQTLKGSVELMLNSKDTPVELRKKVTSPGGTTEAAINHLIQNNFDSIFIKAIDCARLRADELGKNQ